MQLPQTRNMGNWCRCTTHSSSIQITILPANKAFAAEKVAEETGLYALVADMKEARATAVSNLPQNCQRQKLDQTVTQHLHCKKAYSMSPA